MPVPAIISTNAIPRFLDIIHKAAVPEKVDGKYLKSVGFNNSNDAALIPLFKSLGFLDSNGKPTEIYRSYRGASATEAKKELGKAIKACYSGLFGVYPDAYRRDDEALTNWMRANTDKGEATQIRALRTFKVLRDAASFEETAPATVDEVRSESQAQNVPTSGDTPAVAESVGPQIPASPNVSINITLQIVATNDASIYDKFFASMKKHLFPNES